MDTRAELEAIELAIREIRSRIYNAGEVASESGDDRTANAMSQAHDMTFALGRLVSDAAVSIATPEAVKLNAYQIQWVPGGRQLIDEMRGSVAAERGSRARRTIESDGAFLAQQSRIERELKALGASDQAVTDIHSAAINAAYAR